MVANPLDKDVRVKATEIIPGDREVLHQAHPIKITPVYLCRRTPLLNLKCIIPRQV
jgi:hypothetical protein